MSSVLSGGSRRRPGRLRRLAVWALIALFIAAALATVLSGGGGGDASPAASAVPQVPPLRPPGGERELVRAPPGVALASADTVAVRFGAPPRGALLFDLDSGRVLLRRRPLARLPIASLTKVMTALLVVERTTSRERVRIPRAALDFRGSAVGNLRPGRRVPIEGLLGGTLIASGNDTAIALATHVSGSERRFVELMNRRARGLGLGCTSFVSSHGLEPANRSCAADLAALARLAMAETRIARLVGRTRADFRFPIKGGRLFVSSTNPLLLTRYPGAVGLKTGFTARAGRCLIAVARRGGRTLAVVLLDSPDPSRQARRLLDAGFRSLAS